MKLSKGKLPKMLRQKKQSMKRRRKHKPELKLNKSFRKRQKPLNLHRSSVKKIHIGGSSYDVINDQEGGATDKKKHRSKHRKHKDGTKKHSKHHKHSRNKDGTRKHHKHSRNKDGTRKHHRHHKDKDKNKDKDMDATNIESGLPEDQADGVREQMIDKLLDTSAPNAIDDGPPVKMKRVAPPPPPMKPENSSSVTIEEETPNKDESVLTVQEEIKPIDEPVIGEDTVPQASVDPPKEVEESPVKLDVEELGTDTGEATTQDDGAKIADVIPPPGDETSETIVDGATVLATEPTPEVAAVEGEDTKTGEEEAKTGEEAVVEAEGEEAKTGEEAVVEAEGEEAKTGEEAVVEAEGEEEQPEQPEGKFAEDETPEEKATREEFEEAVQETVGTQEDGLTGPFEKSISVITNQMADRISDKIMRKLESMSGSKDTENQDAAAALPAMTAAIQMKGGKPRNGTRKLKMKIGKNKTTRKGNV